MSLIQDGAGYFRSDVEDILNRRKVADTPHNDLRMMLLLFHQAILENAVVWYASAWTRAQSREARRVLQSNLSDVTSERFQRQTSKFEYDVLMVAPVDTLFKESRIWQANRIEASVKTITEGSLKPLQALWLVTMLEVASQAFVPHVNNALATLCITDEGFTNTSNSAELLTALEAEYKIRESQNERDHVTEHYYAVRDPLYAMMSKIFLATAGVPELS